MPARRRAAAAVAGLFLTACTASEPKLPPGARFGGTLRIASVNFASFHEPIRTPGKVFDITFDPVVALNTLSAELLR
ncbi:MAG: hypothetical protein ACRDH5_11530 [bacterium]